MSKNKKLPPDKILQDNIFLIKKIGHISNYGEVMCYASKNIIMQCLADGYPIDVASNKAEKYILSSEGRSKGYAMVSLNNWYHSGRQIYDFDDTLAELLSSQNDKDIVVDINTFGNVPCDHFYVARKYKDSVGFFISIDRENDLIFIGDLRKNREPTGLFAKMKNGTTLKQIIEEVSGTDYTIGNNILAEQITEHLQYIAYLSAINADVTPITKRAVAKRTPQNPTPISNPQKNEISQVGYKIGAELRRAAKQYVYADKSSGDKHGTPKTPHIRRGHFHSYWVGHAEDKRLVHKWVSAVFVGGTQVGDVSTVHKIKDEKHD